MIIIRSRTILARRKFPLNSGGRNRRFEMDVDNNIGSDMKILRFVNFFFCFPRLVAILEKFWITNIGKF